jgi:hypothetical protein
MKVNDILGEDVDAMDAPASVADTPTPGKPVHVGPYQVFGHMNAHQIGLLRRIANGRIDPLDIDADQDPEKHAYLQQLQNLHLVGISDVTELGTQVLHVADGAGGVGAKTKDWRDASAKGEAMRAQNEKKGQQAPDADMDLGGDDSDDIDMGSDDMHNINDDGDIEWD